MGEKKRPLIQMGHDYTLHFLPRPWQELTMWDRLRAWLTRQLSKRRRR